LRNNLRRQELPGRAARKESIGRFQQTLVGRVAALIDARTVRASVMPGSSNPQRVIYLFYREYFSVGFKP
jgi:hypothetical protein